MPSVCLGRYVQISDLHFGDIDPLGKLKHPWWLRKLWKRLPVLSGLVGHEFQALRDLSECFATRMRRWDPAPHLIVTGDLTSLGKDEQFQTVEHFICDQLPSPPFNEGIGLKRNNNWLRDAMQGRQGYPHQVIPGNHDHWPGRYFMLGPPRSRMIEWSGHLPYVQDTPVRLPGTPARLRFLALNSDADVGDWGRKRVLARGSFCSQVEALRAALRGRVKQPDPDEIRVLLVHHSLAYRARSAARPPRTGLGRIRDWWGENTDLGILEVDVSSRWELQELISEYDIRVLLTGHTHQVDVRGHYALSPRRGRPVPYLEACCGTTTQLNTAPSGYSERERPAAQETSRPGEEQQIAANTFLVHELHYDGGTIEWQTETWERLLIDGFRRSQRNARGEPYARRFPVWPRS
jgi:hypothetical protein